MIVLFIIGMRMKFGGVDHNFKGTHNNMLHMRVLDDYIITKALEASTHLVYSQGNIKIYGQIMRGGGYLSYYHTTVPQRS